MPAAAPREKIVGRPCKNCGGTQRYAGSYSCISCNNARAKINKKKQSYILQAKRRRFGILYGVTPETIALMLDSQGGKCAICGTNKPTTKRGWVVDHDHQTGKARGILCDHCNVGIGRLGDSIERLHNAMNYLRRALNAG